MLWRKKTRNKHSKARTLSLIFRASFAGLCFAAFAIYVWGVQISQVAELILFLILVVLVMIVPAAIFVGLMKFIPYVFRSIRDNPKKSEE